jgi:hypothetical protein
LGWASEPVSGGKGGGVTLGVTATSGVRGPNEQPAINATTIAGPTSRHRSPFFMGLILLEAFLAGAVFILIVWWTMFSGRKGGEIDHGDDAHHAAEDAKPSKRD